MKVIFVFLLLALFSSLIHAQITWSGVAQQQVKDWANGGSQPWVHTIEKGKGRPGATR
jgi:hypothetical protein